MLRDILSSAKRAIATGEPMNLTIRGPVIEEREEERENKRVRSEIPLEEAIKMSLADLSQKNQDLLLSGELQSERGGRKTKKAKTNKKSNKSRKSKKQNKRKSRKQNKRKSRK